MDGKMVEMMANGGHAKVLDVVLACQAHPLEAAEVLCAARDAGCRSVRVPLSLAPVAAKALRGSGCAVGSACVGKVGWLGGQTLAWVSQGLCGAGLDELDISVEAGAIAEGDGAAELQLRQVSALCHAHGMLANAAVSVSGLTSEQVRTAVRGALKGGTDFMTLVAPAGGSVPVELVAAAVSEAHRRIRIRVAGDVDSEEVERLVNLGVFSIELAA